MMYCMCIGRKHTKWTWSTAFLLKLRTNPYKNHLAIDELSVLCGYFDSGWSAQKWFYHSDRWRIARFACKAPLTDARRTEIEAQWSVLEANLPLVKIEQTDSDRFDSKSRRFFSFHECRLDSFGSSTLNSLSGSKKNPLFGLCVVVYSHIWVIWRMI